MADDAVFPSAADCFSPNSGLQITMQGGSGDSEQLMDEDVAEGFEIEADELGDERNQILDVERNDLENAIQRVLGIDRSDLDSELGIDCMDLVDDGEHMLEFESNAEEMIGIQHEDIERATDDDAVLVNSQNDEPQGMSYVPPVVGMEFESYDDAYNYYNYYARELGFGIRVKSSWTKRNSKEKRGAVLCCNCEGFKIMKESSSKRKETRTGCLAMIRLRLVESNRWRLDEVKLEHNHLFDHQRAQSSRSHKKMELGAKRKLESQVDVEVQTIKLYRTSGFNVENHGNSNEREPNNHVQMSKHLKLGKDDIPVLCSYFRERQLVDANFLHLMDFGEDGVLRNVFWIDSRSRGVYRYFGDVVVVDTLYLSNNHDVPLLVFSGLNHHGDSVLLGFGLLCDKTMETYIWLMRAWLTCMSGRGPKTIITDQCSALRGAISEVFPRAHHRLSLPLIMQKICRKLGELGESEAFRAVLNRTVYGCFKTEEFELAWDEMIQHFMIEDHEFLQSLYQDRERWVPAYSKNTLFSGIYTSLESNCMNSFFNEYLRENMNLNEFFNMCEFVQQEKIKKEVLEDFESREFKPVLRTSCNYEVQLSELYTKEIFLEFQAEVVQMSCCCSVTQIQINGPIITYLVKEQVSEGELGELKNFEVDYDKLGTEVRCICGCFNSRGYLCRHALTVLHYTMVEEIPSQYILTRWRKDLKRLYTIDPGLNNIDISNPVEWFNHLHRRAMQVVAEGMASQGHHMAAWQAFKETLNKVRSLVSEKPP